MLTTAQKRQYLLNIAAGGNGEVTGTIRECTSVEKAKAGQPQFVVYWDGNLYFVDTMEHAEMIRSMLDGTHGLEI